MDLAPPDFSWRSLHRQTRRQAVDPDSAEALLQAGRAPLKIRWTDRSLRHLMDEATYGGRIAKPSSIAGGHLHDVESLQHLESAKGTFPDH
jgi:hypothetical protein